ncbi:MAG: LptF/LptG family permease, partial [Candidatus Ratteibacteria bacterium]
LTPYQEEVRNVGKKTDSLSVLTEKICFWAENYKRPNTAMNVIILEGRNFNISYHARKAIFLEKSIILYDGNVMNGDKVSQYFQQFVINTDFDPRLLLFYAAGFPERLAFFKLRRLLKNVALVGIISKSDWIFLYSKISYPALNIFIILILFPFFYYRKFVTKTRIFIVAFAGTLVTYSLYSSSLSLGKAEIIPWQIAPWISHGILAIFFILYLSVVKKKMYNFM